MTSSKSASKCRANLSKVSSMSKSKSLNESAWAGHSNNRKFMNSLTNFMNESWVAVSQIREKSGLSSSFEISGGDIQKKIQEVLQKLDAKYKEVAELEAEKAKLESKSGQGQAVAFAMGPGPSRGPVPQSQQWQPPASSARMIQFAQSGGESGCPPECDGASSGYQNYSAEVSRHFDYDHEFSYKQPLL